jgi:hypothetical protein
MTYDKKAMNKTPGFSLLKKIGEALIDQKCDEEFVKASIEFYSEKSKETA